MRIEETDYEADWKEIIMGEGTQCNFCSLKGIRERARKEKKKVIIRACWTGPPIGGFDIFLVPAGKQLPICQGPSKKLPNGDKIYQQYNEAWMLEIPEYCEC